MMHAWVVFEIDPPTVSKDNLCGVARYNNRALFCLRETLGCALEFDEMIVVLDYKPFQQWGCRKAAHMTAKVMAGRRIEMPKQRADWRDHQ